MGWERTEPSKVSVLVMLVDGGDGCSPLMSAAKCRGSGAADLYNIFSGEDPNLSFTFEAKVTIGDAASSSSSAQSAHDLLVSMPTRARIICCHLWALQGVFALLRCDSLGIVRAHATWRVRAASASGHALVRMIHRARGLLHRVVRLHLAHCHHVSAYGTATMVVSGMHSVWTMHVAREQ